MTMDSKIDHIAWARRVNERWIVHNKLNETAAAYMEHLVQADYDRLGRSCRLAYLLVHSLEPMEDPKPWFYGGLFSLATSSEANQFLAGHSLLASVVPALQTGNSLPALDSVDPTTRWKILRLRDAIDRLTRDANDKCDPETHGALG